jgi:hypothetical protein
LRFVAAEFNRSDAGSGLTTSLPKGSTIMSQPQDAALTAILRGLMDRQSFMALVGPNQVELGQALAETMSVLTPLVRIELVALDSPSSKGIAEPLTLGVVATRILGRPAQAHQVADVEELLTRLTRPVGTESRVVLILSGAGRLRADSFSYLQMAADLTSRTGFQLHVVFVAAGGFWHLLQQEGGRLAENVQVRYDMFAPGGVAAPASAGLPHPASGFWQFGNRRSLVAAIAIGAFFVGGDVAHGPDLQPDQRQIAPDAVRLAANDPAPSAEPVPTVPAPEAEADVPPAPVVKDEPAAAAESAPPPPAPEAAPAAAAAPSTPEPVAPQVAAPQTPPAEPPSVASDESAPGSPPASAPAAEPAKPADAPAAPPADVAVPPPGAIPNAAPALTPVAPADVAPAPEPQAATPPTPPAVAPEPAAPAAPAAPPSTSATSPEPAPAAPAPEPPPVTAPPPAAEAAPAPAPAAPPAEPPASVAAPDPAKTEPPAPEAPPPPPQVVEPAPAPPPPPVLPIAPPPPPAPASRAAAPPSPAAQAMLDMLQRRGDEMLATGDVSAARRLYERGVAGHSPRAALALARTYDPRVLATLGVKGIAGDVPAATRWYREALALGSEEARTALDELAKLK